MLDSFDHPLWRFFTNNNKERAAAIPAITITPTARRTSVSTPLRFTRTCSQDSLNALEKTCRQELRRQHLIMEAQDTAASALSPSSSSMCPHMADIGRSRTEPGDLDAVSPTSSSPVLRSICDLSMEPSQSISSKKRLADIIGLSPYQQKLLLQSWPNIYSTGVGGQFASSIYANLCSKSPKGKQMFSKANSVSVFTNSDLDCTAMHSRTTLELFDTVIRNLDKEHAKLTAYLVEMGKCHRSLKAEGFTHNVWDDLGDALLESIRRFDSIRKHKELRRAWLSLIAYVIDNLKQGHSFRSSSSGYDLSSYEPATNSGGSQGKRSFS